jgi:membrane protein implicated in regulation of membrane protease activity
MSDWIIWLLSAGVLVVLEMFTGTFYLLMVAIGMVAGGLGALAGASGPLQLVVASVVGILATYALRRSGFGKFARTDPARDPNVNLDIGQTVTVSEWQSAGGGMYTARTMYRGAMWDVELQPGFAAQAGSFVIRELRGSRLIVTGSGSNNN